MELAARGDGAVVRLDDGQRVNILSARRVDALASLLDSLTEPPRPRWLLLCGNGRGSFAAGADLKEIAALGAAAAIELSRSGGRLTDRLSQGPWWTGAVVDGHALGGGFDVAAACDLVVATPRARFGHPGVARGLFTGWGGTEIIPSRGRFGPMRKALLSGEELTAEEARGAGLVSEVAAPSRATSAAIAMLDRLANWSAAEREAWRAARRLRSAALCGALSRLAAAGPR